MKLNLLSGAIFSALAIAGLQSCGGGSSSTAATGSTVVGTIIGFGSIIMDNGNKYETDNINTCNVDDQAASGTCEDSLSTGMRVKLSIDDNGNVTGVDYDDELEGIASGTTGINGDFTFEIYGVTVRTINPGTVWDDFSPDPTSPADIDGMNLEVSGEWNGTELVASYVEKQSDTDGELKGTVSGLTSGSSDFMLTLRNGSMVMINGNALSSLPANGDFVELDGTFNTSTNKFDATGFELEDDDDFEDDSEVEITGKLVDDGKGGYSIGNTAVDISGASECAGLVGSIVEAEGNYDANNKVLIVEECEDEDDEIEVKCDISNVVPDSSEPKAGTAECHFNGTTGGPLSVSFSSTNLAMFSGDSKSDPFNLNDLLSGGCVEMKLSGDGNDGYSAGLIEDEHEAVCSEQEVEAIAETVNASDITVLGISFDITGAMISNGPASAGDKVKLKDSTADGIFEEVEVD